MDELTKWCMALSESAFAEIWDSPEDDVWDKLEDED